MPTDAPEGREPSSATSDDDLCTCEDCGAQHEWEATTLTADGVHVCRTCQTAWEAEFAACEHDWRPGEDEHGDPAQICEICSGLVPDHEWSRLFPGKPLPGTQAP